MTKIYKPLWGNYSISEDGELLETRTDYKVKSPKTKHLGSSGYYVTKIKDKSGVYKNFSFHRLVAMAFIPNPENKKEVDHINGDKLDNRACNLRWVTRSENEIYKNKIFGSRNGLRSPNSKLSVEDVFTIRKLRKEKKLTYPVLAKMFKLHEAYVNKICIKKIWADK
jgi:hypothetical protein